MAPGPSLGRPGGGMPRCCSCARSGRTAWPDAHPTPRGRPVRRHAHTRAQRRPGAPVPAATTGFAPPGLDAGFLIDAEHVIARPQRCAFPTTSIQINDAAGLAGKVRVARKHRTAMAPRPQGVLAKPPPERGAADLGNDAARQRLLAQLGNRRTSQRQATA